MAAPKADLPQGTLDLLILKVVALGPVHGYAIAQRIRQRSNTDSCQRRRAAIARHVPGNGAIATSKEIQLSAPGPRSTADSMQERQRRMGGIACGLIAKATVLRFQRHKIGNAGPP